jgi:hypothetical protein
MHGANRPAFVCLLLQRHHTAVSAIGYDDKSGLLVVAGDSGRISSSSALSSHSSSSSASAPAAAYAEQGVTVSVWQLQDRQLHLKFALGSPLVSLLLCALGRRKWQLLDCL